MKIYESICSRFLSSTPVDDGSTIWENKFIKSKYTYAPRPGGEKKKVFPRPTPGLIMMTTGKWHATERDDAFENIIYGAEQGPSRVRGQLEMFCWCCREEQQTANYYAVFSSNVDTFLWPSHSLVDRQHFYLFRQGASRFKRVRTLKSDKLACFHSDTCPGRVHSDVVGTLRLSIKTTLSPCVYSYETSL